MATAVSPNIVSGLVVATVIVPEPSLSGYFKYHILPSTSRITTSSSAMAVFVFGSQFTRRRPRSIKPSLNSLKNPSRTPAAHTGSMVKRVRSKSHEQPMATSCSKITRSYSSFHACTCATNSSRVKSVRFLPCSASRRSTTVCVAIPAWSVPGIHKTSRPRMRACRANVSCNVLLSACPKCSAAVTLGGGINIVNGSDFESGRALKHPLSRQRADMALSCSPGR